MENLKFRLKVRKMKCASCDTITLIEFKQPIAPLYACPICDDYMEQMDDITIVQEED